MYILAGTVLALLLVGVFFEMHEPGFYREVWHALKSSTKGSP